MTGTDPAEVPENRLPFGLLVEPSRCLVLRASTRQAAAHMPHHNEESTDISQNGGEYAPTPAWLGHAVPIGIQAHRA